MKFLANSARSLTSHQSSHASTRSKNRLIPPRGNVCLNSTASYLTRILVRREELVSTTFKTLWLKYFVQCPPFSSSPVDKVNFSMMHTNPFVFFFDASFLTCRNLSYTTGQYYA